MPRRLKDWIRSYLEWSDSSEHPNNFRLWTAIATVSGALQRKVWLSQEIFTWYPNFYVFLVAPSGVVSKTTAVGMGMRLLREVPAVRFGPRAATWQGVVKKLAEEHQEFPLHKGEDITDTEFEGMSALIIEAGELGTFLNPHDREQIDVFVDLWDCPTGTWEKWTATVGCEKVVNPCVSIVGGTTPTWIAEHCSTHFVGGGFASRCVFVFEERKRKLVAYPSRHMGERERKLKEALIEDLSDINSLIGEYQLSPDAIEWGEDWYEHHNTEDHPFRGTESFGGYMARKQAHIHKLGMIRAASKHSNLIVTSEELMWAEELVTGLEKNMPLVYGHVGQEKEAKVSGQIIDKLLSRGGRMPKSLLLRMFSSTIGVSTFNEAIDTLMQSECVRQIAEEGGEIWIELKIGRDDILQRKGVV